MSAENNMIKDILDIPICAYEKWCGTAIYIPLISAKRICTPVEKYAPPPPNTLIYVRQCA